VPLVIPVGGCSVDKCLATQPFDEFGNRSARHAQAFRQLPPQASFPALDLGQKKVLTVSCRPDWFTTPVPVVGCECDWQWDLNFFGSLVPGNMAA
jgi:hypothetical protein